MVSVASASSQKAAHRVGEGEGEVPVAAKPTYLG